MVQASGGLQPTAVVYGSAPAAAWGDAIVKA